MSCRRTPNPSVVAPWRRFPGNIPSWTLAPVLVPAYTVNWSNSRDPVPVPGPADVMPGDREVRHPPFVTAKSLRNTGLQR